MPSSQTFDAAQPMIMSRGHTVAGHPLVRSTRITIVDDESDKPGHLTAAQAEHLFRSGVLVYAANALPTPVETPRQAATRLATIEELGRGRFLIRAPWLDEGEKISGAEAAVKRHAEVIEDGVVQYRELLQKGGVVAAAAVLSEQDDGFALVEAGSNGYYEITGPGLDEPEKVRGKQKAEDRLAELRAAEAEKAAAIQPPSQPAILTAEVPPAAAPGAPVSVADAEDETADDEGAAEPE